MDSRETEILVQVVPSPSQAGELSRGTITERFGDRVAELGESLGEIANGLRQQLDRTLHAENSPGWGLEEVTLNFSLDLEAETGMVLVKGKTTAGFDVSLTWKRRSGDD
jgi:hypothetical protein